MRSVLLLCLVAVGLAVTGCGSTGSATRAVPDLPQAMPVDPPGGSYLLTANTYAGDALYKMLLLRMGSGGGILTTTFVDLNNFAKTSAFGRVTSQQIGSRIGQYGFRVLEARLAATLRMVPRSGEFMLTRETARLLSDEYDAHAVLVGTYEVDGGKVFVSARVVRLADNAIMAAYEYYLPYDGDVSRLLANAGQGGCDPVWERFSRRRQAFSPTAVAAASNGGTAGTSAARPTPSRAAPEKSKPAPAVPRHVTPAPDAPQKDTPAPAVTPQKATPAPAVTPQKDMPSPPGVPGGTP